MVDADLRVERVELGAILEQLAATWFPASSADQAANGALPLEVHGTSMEMTT
jgi:hypothetical protein